MKKILYVLVIFVFSLISTGCFNSKDKVEKENELDDNVVLFNPASSVSEFTLEDIQSLAIDFSGTKEEIAQQIYDWQTQNMEYKAFGEVSDAMRWNYFLPGIYPTKDMIKDFSVLDNKKIEGLCYQFATIYCSIANYYDIECRVTAMKEKPSNLDSSIDKNTTTGLSETEYNRLKERLSEKGLYYSYDTIRSVASETSAHYHAEVKIDDNWKVMDATEYFVGGTYNQTYTFYEVDWLEGYNENLLGKSEKDISQDTTDDLGDKNRAKTIEEVRENSALVPYYNTFEKISAFLKLPSSVEKELKEEFNLYLEFDKKYYEATGEHFYIICDFIIEEDLESNEYAKQYKELTGNDLDLDTFSLLEEMFD